MKQETIEGAAFNYAAQRFPNAKNKDCGIVAQEQYACRAGFMAGVEWQKEQSYNNPNAIESLVNILSTPVARRKGSLFQKKIAKNGLKN